MLPDIGFFSYLYYIDIIWILGDDRLFADVNQQTVPYNHLISASSQLTIAARAAFQLMAISFEAYDAMWSL